ncbi:MAG: type II secretion system protein [Candidatus Aphodocola sp.]
MKKNNKGFTLIELLAVIVVLSIILTIATTAVLKTIKDSKEKAKYIAAKEIVDIAEAYFATNSSATDVTINDLSDYLQSDATNPATGENDLLNNGTNQKVCKSTSYSSNNQNGYEISSNGYEFDGYWYGIDGNCK